MKKALAILCAVGLLVLTASTLYAGGIINKNNQSADYMRTLNRAAATDLADIAVYNPAGIAQMADGLYTKLDVMYYAKDYSNTIPAGAFPSFTEDFGKLDQDEASTIPGFFTIYKQDRWAGFFAFSIPAGGGELDYQSGSVRTVRLANRLAGGGLLFDTIDSQKEEVKDSEAYGFTVGGSYALNDAWSVALGVRYTYAKREFDGEAVLSGGGIGGLAGPQKFQLNIKEDDDGWAGIVGVNYKPAKNLNFAATLITKTEIEYERDVKKDTDLTQPQFGGFYAPFERLSEAAGFKDGSKIRDDIPGQLSLGASYEFFIPLKLDLTYVRYFERSATIETFEDEGDSWDLGISAEYTFTPQWKASIGYLYTDIDLPDDQQIEQPEEPKLDANSIAGGVVWSPTEKWAITLAGALIMYEDVTDSLGINYDKDVWNLSAGVQYKWF